MALYAWSARTRESPTRAYPVPLGTLNNLRTAKGPTAHSSTIATIELRAGNQMLQARALLRGRVVKALQKMIHHRLSKAIEQTIYDTLHGAGGKLGLAQRRAIDVGVLFFLAQQ